MHSGGVVVRVVAETSYRADVAFCLLTLLAALVIACDTGGVGSSLSSGSSDDGAQSSAQVVEYRDALPPTVARSSPGEAITRR
jgi:hypothetical protein